jgi:hypothetical protein
MWRRLCSPKLGLDGHTDSLYDEVAYRLQSEQYDQWLSTVADAKLSKSVDDGALATNAAYLYGFITADASTELVSR